MKTIKIFAVATSALLLTAPALPVAAQSAAWQGQVSALMKERFSYPRSAIVRGDEGRAVVRLAVAGDGNVTRVTLSQSSGSAILDREAMRIAGKLSRVPAPPRGVSSIDIPIKWALN